MLPQRRMSFLTHTHTHTHTHTEWGRIMCACVGRAGGGGGCQNDILHWVNTPTLDSCFGLVGHHQQGAECDSVESQPLNILVYAQPLACECKLRKITTLACAVTMTTRNHKTSEKLLPTVCVGGGGW